MIWYFVLFLAGQLPSSLPHWDVESVQALDLFGMESPTGVLRTEAGWLAVSGLEEAFPGIYALTQQEDGFHAQLLKYLPQMDVEDLAMGSGSDSLRIISSRKFSPDPADWTGQTIAFEPTQLQISEKTALTVSPKCFDQSMHCGLVAVELLSESVLVAVKKKDVSTLYIFEKRNSGWFLKSESSLTLNRRFVTISAVRRKNELLYFLVKDKWLLASLPITALNQEVDGELRLEPQFDFGAIQKMWALSDISLAFEGLAEGFDFDRHGNLVILLNNRGKKFQGAPGQAPSPLPKLLRFLQLKVESEELDPP